MSEPYLIWSNEHRAWWGPDCKGYTIHIGNAGVYDRDKALEICATTRDGWGAGKYPSEIPIRQNDVERCKQIFLSIEHPRIRPMSEKPEPISERKTEMEWQPIDTAPKDGSFVLLAFVGEMEGEPYSFSTFGNWNEGYQDMPDEMGHDAGWADYHWNNFIPSRSFGNPEYQNKGRQPTHWMPLPTPPEDKDNG